MIDQADMIELVLRGASFGLSALIGALIFMSPAPPVRRYLGVLFITGICMYTLVSAPTELQMTGGLAPLFRFVATYNTILFWWFALSLFDDDFQWDWIKIAPFVAMFILHLPLGLWPHAGPDPVHVVLHSGIALSVLVHTVWIVLRERGDDLFDTRRRFRVVFAGAIGVVGIVITLAEGALYFGWLSVAPTLAHAFLLAVLSAFFAGWMLTATPVFFAVPERATERNLDTPLTASPDPVRAKLFALMDQGVYREEGLSIASLASRVGVPEHQLRRLINQDLGFKNFSTFLNARRIEDAKAALTDPANARKQVLQIALDLGYGSIAPFNRAFKSATGVTPTQYRRENTPQG